MQNPYFMFCILTACDGLGDRAVELTRGFLRLTDSQWSLYSPSSECAPALAGGADLWARRYLGARLPVSRVLEGVFLRDWTARYSVSTRLARFVGTETLL